MSAPEEAAAESADGAGGGAANPAGSDIIIRIRSLLPSLTPAEQRVGRAVISDPEGMARLTISELARLADTSDTTVVRFCRSVDVPSYPDLRIAVATWSGRAVADGDLLVSPPIRAGDGLAEVVAKIAGADAQAVRSTAAALNLTQLAAAIDAITGARRIDIYGLGASAFVALDLQQKLHRIGLVVFAWGDPHMAVTSAANLRPGDVAIGLSHTGTSMDTVDALRQARHRGAQTIAITNFATSPITAEADLLLCTSVQETTFRDGAMASRIAALTVVDCLFVGVAQRNHASAAAAMARTQDALNSRRLPSR